MKKLRLILVLGFAVLAFTACKKKYTCTETYSVNGVLANTTIYTYEALTTEELSYVENLGTYSYVDGDGDQIAYSTTCD